MVALRLAFALTATYVMVLFMSDGQFGAAAFVLVAAVVVRRAVDDGRLLPTLGRDHD